MIAKPGDFGLGLREKVENRDALALRPERDAIEAEPIGERRLRGTFCEIQADARRSSQELVAKMSGQPQRKHRAIKLQRELVTAKVCETHFSVLSRRFVLMRPHA